MIQTVVFILSIVCQRSMPFKIDLPAGYMVRLEFVANDNVADDGKGFRLEWTCFDYTPDEIVHLPNNIE